MSVGDVEHEQITSVGEQGSVGVADEAGEKQMISIYIGWLICVWGKVG